MAELNDHPGAMTTPSPSPRRSSLLPAPAITLLGILVSVATLLLPATLAPASAAQPNPPAAVRQALDHSRSQPPAAAPPRSQLGARLCATSRYRWPTSSPAPVVTPFDPPAQRWGRGHRGVDLATAPAAPVRAPATGRVVYAGTLAGRGVVSIAHPDGIRTTYEPVSPSVSQGQVVSPGQQIGTLEPGGSGHTASSPALHWGARIGKDRYVNPLRLLCPAVIILKPVS